MNLKMGSAGALSGRDLLKLEWIRRIPFQKNISSLLQQQPWHTGKQGWWLPHIQGLMRRLLIRSRFFNNTTLILQHLYGYMLSWVAWKGISGQRVWEPGSLLTMSTWTGKPGAITMWTGMPIGYNSWRKPDCWTGCWYLMMQAGIHREKRTVEISPVLPEFLQPLFLHLKNWDFPGMTLNNYWK